MADLNQSSEGAPWVRVLSRFLGTLGIGANDGAVVCDIDTDGAMHISGLDSGARYRLSDAGVEAWTEPPGPFDDDPTTGIWDAPTAAKNPAFENVLKLNDSERETLTRQTREILHTATEYAACELALDVLLTYVPAESASILIADGVNLRFASARGPRADALIGMEMPGTEGIAGLVAGSGTTLMVQDARAANQHYDAVDTRLGYQTRSLLAVPVQHNGRTFGVLEILNPYGTDVFVDWHQQITQEISQTLGRRLSDTQAS